MNGPRKSPRSVAFEGGVDAACARDIEAAQDAQARRAELEALVHTVGSPMRTAQRFGVVDVIEPARTRAVLCVGAEDAHAVCAKHIGPKLRSMR